MPRKKKVESRISVFKVNWSEKLQKVNVYLTTIFLILWIFIGLFGSLVVVQSVKQGFLQGIFGKSQQAPAQSQPQAEADLPGVGKVNITCTEQALSQDSIQKLLAKGDNSVLTADEKAKLQPCIVAAASATPSATPGAQ